MIRFYVFAVAVLISLVGSVVALAQGPSAPPPSCEEKLDNATFQAGGLMQQLAVATAQLRAMTKERDEAKAALIKATAKPEEKK